jgi:hypothetical protein
MERKRRADKSLFMDFIAIFKRSTLYLAVRVQGLPKLQKFITFAVLFTRITLNNIMQTQRSSSILIAAGLLTVVLLPSCSLPPGVAWREIQSEGLIPFLQNGMSAPKAQTQPQGLYANTGPASKVVEPPQPTLNKASATQPSSTAFPPAYAVAGLSGYVRTPFTNPPRLVDVRGMNPGAKVVCPYTQKPFVVPAAAASSTPRNVSPQLATTKSQSQPKPQKSAVAPTQPKPTPTPAVVKTQPAPAPTPAPAPAPKIASAPKPQPSVPQVTKPKAKETPQVAATTPPPTKPAPAPAAAPSKIQTTPPPAPAPVAKLPYGTAISGRPGFVNSPYAEKHQLVDVTGLAVGTEVKCPYTGKLFRVPLQQQAKK